MTLVFGLGARSFVGTLPPAQLQPSAQWSGAAGTGFGTANPVAPSDPTRTTAKPVVRLLDPPNQYFEDTLTVSVMAFANNDETLIGGIEKVVFHLEGASVDVLTPQLRAFTRYDGTPYVLPCYTVTLKKPVSTAGLASLYIEGIPTDATMQSRVLGPYQFGLVETKHDYEIEVAPSLSVVAGSRYQTLDAALSYLRTQSAQNPLVTITEASEFDMAPPAFTYAGGAGYCTITATAPVTFKKTGAFDSANQIFRPRYNGLWFRGPNITFDFRNVVYLGQESGATSEHVFEGVNFTDSSGRYAPVNLGKKPMQRISQGLPWFMECTVDKVLFPFSDASLARGCIADDGAEDVFANARCVVGCLVNDWTSGEWREKIPALTVQYSGTGTGTLELSGANDTAGRTFNAKVDGVSVGTFSVQISPADFAANTNYTVQNVADWVNGLADWSATVLDTTRRAATLSLTTAGSGGAFGATDAKTAPLTLVSMFDMHTDVWRTFGSANVNMVVAHNRFVDVNAQVIFFQSTTATQDIAVVNNVFKLNELEDGWDDWFSQMQGVQSHVIFAHNSSANQALLLRDALTNKYNPDAYCLIANNALPQIGREALPDTDGAITDNHTFAGTTAPAGSTGTTIGGNKSSLFVNADGGDFTPAGDLLDNLKSPVFKFDITGAQRGATAAVGAVI